MASSSPPVLDASLPPGPANLIADAVLPNDDDDPVEAEVREVEHEEDERGRKRSGVEGRKKTMTTTGHSSTTSTDSSVDRSKPRATTTVTTIHHGDRENKEGVVSTSTYMHVNATSVNSNIAPDGSVTLKPIPPRGTRVKTRKTTNRSIAFQPRTSTFDRNNSDSAKDPFRGFFVLFWIMIFVGALRVGIKHYSEHGTLFRWTFAKFICKDGFALAASDAVMLASTFLCVPFAKALKNGWIRYRGPGIVVQHIAQTAFLALSVRWTFHKSWPWVQSGFLVLHTLTMLMKVHSYCACNGELSETSRELKQKRDALDRIVRDKGGADKCERDARSAWEKEVKEQEGGGTDDSAIDDSPSTSNADVTASDYAPTGLRQRPAVGSKSRRRSSATSGGDANVGGGRSSSIPRAKFIPLAGIESLTWHPDEELSRLAIDVADLDEALVSTGVKKVRWPANVTYLNFVDYLLVPTLVYHLEYPRTNHIRPLYVVEKIAATFGTFMILLLIVEHAIIPAYPKDGDPFIVSLLDLAIPFMVNYLLIFYIIFECILNGFAELTFFADRGFYSDWWNSQSFDEFSRKWNVPVHSFLLRHVYTSTISTYRFSKFQAAFATFLLSACVHELVMVVAMKKVRLYLFLMQMCQLPLIMAGRLPILRRYPALGNLFFWIGLLSGFPLLAVCYIRY